MSEIATPTPEAGKKYDTEAMSLLAEVFVDHYEKLDPAFVRDLVLDLSERIPAEVLLTALANAIDASVPEIVFLSGMFGEPLTAEKAAQESLEAFIGAFRTFMAARTKPPENAHEDVDATEAATACGCSKGVL